MLRSLLSAALVLGLVSLTAVPSVAQEKPKTKVSLRQQLDELEGERKRELKKGDEAHQKELGKLRKPDGEEGAPVDADARRKKAGELAASRNEAIVMLELGYAEKRRRVLGKKDDGRKRGKAAQALLTLEDKRAKKVREATEAFKKQVKKARKEAGGDKAAPAFQKRRDDLEKQLQVTLIGIEVGFAKKRAQVFAETAKTKPTAKDGGKGKEPPKPKEADTGKKKRKKKKKKEKGQ